MVKLDLKTFNNLPISFQENQGQTTANIDFLARGINYQMFLMPSEIMLSLRKPTTSKRDNIQIGLDLEQESTSVLSIKLVGGNKDAKAIGLEELFCKSNYFIGNNPEKWHSHIPNFSKVKYEDIYPGIDIIYYGNKNDLEWDFIIHPGINPNIISLGFEGVTNLTLDEHNSLIVNINDTFTHLKKPLAYQEINGELVNVSATYVILNNNQVSLNIGYYDSTKPLIIDPILNWSTYYGGGSNDVGTSIAIDSTGDVYITGYTESITFPGPPPLIAYAAALDAFVAKIKGDGSGVVFFTYLGGSNSTDPGSYGPHDIGYGIALDSNNNICITGATYCSNFPVFNAMQGSTGGYLDVFVTKISSDGASLIYSTYFGRGDYERGFGIAVDSFDNVYITGYTRSFGFPTTPGALKPNKIDLSLDAFILKLTSAGALSYCSYLGGPLDDSGQSIATDANGNVYIMGNTKGNFPIAGTPLQPTYGGGAYDIFITKLNPIGAAYAYEYSTYLGGSGYDYADDYGQSIAVDLDGNVYVTGYTSGNFPMQNPIQPTFGGGNWDAFVSKIDPTGSSLIYSTYLGGSGDDIGLGIATDSSFNAYVIGYTNSSGAPPAGFPIQDAIQPAYGGNVDAFVTKISADGSTLIYSTYLGGSNSDVGYGITVDSNNNAFITGGTSSSGSPPPGPGFPTMNPFQANNNGLSDVFIGKISVKPPTPPPSVQPSPSRGIDFFK